METISLSETTSAYPVAVQMWNLNFLEKVYAEFD
jgi:hypothetical protein